METVLIGPYWIPGRSTTQQVRATSSGRAIDGFLYDRHVSQMVRLAFEPVATIATELGEVTLHEGAAEIGFAELTLRAADRDAMHALEPRAKELVDRALGERYGSEHPRRADYPRAAILWWHRVLLEPGEDEPRAIRLFGERFLANDDVSGCVANGFTSVDSTAGDLVSDVVGGLMAATEDWLMIDDLSRRLTTVLLTTHADDVVLGEVLEEAEGLTEEVALAVLLIDERRRHLANAVQRVHRAAHVVWELGEVRESLLRNAESVQSLIRMEHARREARYDARRNNILFGFTAVTVLQSVLLLLEFAVAAPLGVTSGVRVAISGVIAALTVAILVRYMRGDPR